MAVNPITTEDLTINFSDLLKIPVGDRVQAAMLSPDYSNALLNSLTPIQMAKAFPDYYRRELPDISNFILGNRYLDEHGAGAFHQRGGGDYGEQKGTAAPPPPPKSIVDKILEGAQITEIVDGVVKRDAGQRGELGFTQDTKMDPRKRALLDAIATDSGGGYGTVNYVARGQGTQDVTDLSQGHPFITADGRVLKGYTASGRYQMLATNYDAFAKKIGAINPETGNPDFSPEAQDRVAWEMAKDVYRKGTGGRNLEEDINDPNITPEQLIRPMSIDYGWHILKSESGIRKATNVFNENEAIYQQDVKTAIEEAAKKETGPKVQVSPEVAEILNSNPETKKYFIEDKPDMGIRLQEQINAGIMSIDDLKNKIRSNSQQIGELIKTVYEDSSEQFDITANMKGVDPRLAEISKVAAEEFPLRVRLFSGKRSDTGAHGRGLAIDTQLFDEAGVPIASYKTPQTANIYALWAEKMREVQQRLYPELNDEFVWGGAFSGLEIGKYGAADWMDFRIGRHGGVETETMKSYKFGEGFQNPNYVASAENDFLGIGNRPVTLDDLKLLEGFRLTKEQQDIQRQIALNGDPQGRFDSGLLNQPNIGERKLPAGTVVAENSKEVETKQQRIFLGDSIAQGMKDVSKGEGTTQVGRKPHEVLSDMEALGPEYFKDKEVILSTGLSNNTEDLESVRKQMEFLKQSGANVKIAGMSNSREDLAPGNEQLQSLAGEYGYQFMGGYDAGKDKVHPTDYSSYLASATPAKEEVPTYQYGGTPETQDDEDLMAVGSDGNPVFRFNSGEGLYVKPEANEYADEKMAELSGRLDDLSSRFDTPNEQSQMQQSRPRTDQKNPWSQKVIAADRPRSPSADRANRRTKFMNEGWRPGGRGSPNSITS